MELRLNQSGDGAAESSPAKENQEAVNRIGSSPINTSSIPSSIKVPFSPRFRQSGTSKRLCSMDAEGTSHGQSMGCPGDIHRSLLMQPHSRDVWMYLLGMI